MSPDVLKLSLSCAECRSRKIKCDRADPCGSCVARNVKCSKEVLRKPNRKKRVSVDHARTREPSSPPGSGPTTAVTAAAVLPSGGHRSDLIATPQRSGHDEAVPPTQPLTPWSPPNEMVSTSAPSLSASVSHLSAPSAASHLNVTAYDGLKDVLFSDEFLDSLIGASEKHTPASHSNSGSTMSERLTNCTSASSYSPSSAHGNAATMPLRNSLCVLSFRLDASVLSEQIILEYRQCLPNPCSSEQLVATLDRRTTLLSFRPESNTFLDIEHYTEMLRSHFLLLIQADPPGWTSLTAQDIFHIVCGLYLTATIEKQDVKAVATLARKLCRQLAGCETNLQLLQSYRMLAAARGNDNETELAALAISSGSRAAVSMGIQNVSSVAGKPAREQAYLTDAMLGLLCDACSVQAIFGIRTPVDPANMEAPLSDLGESTLTNVPENYQSSEARLHLSMESHGSQRIAPARMRMHATIWIFVERYYGSSVYVRLPTEENLHTIAPLVTAEPFELFQCTSLSAILRHSSMLIERPLAPWLSPLRRSNPPTTEADSIGLSKAIQVLFLIRYYHILVVYPFVRLNAEARPMLEETVRSIISSTWRLAKRCDSDSSMSNLDFCRRICLRALAFLVAASGSLPSAYSKGESLVPCIDHKERIVADLELGVDAIEKIDLILADKQPLASLASELTMSGMQLDGAR